MSRSIHCYKIPYKLKELLIEHQFTLSGDLFTLSPQQLSTIIHQPMEECEVIIKAINSDRPRLEDTVDAFNLLKRELSQSTIFTLCNRLNSALGLGFPLGRLCEIVGGSGTGKTQICLQLCVTVQLPIETAGLAGDALFIDTENTFRSSRILEIASIFKNQANFNVDQVLEHIFIERCLNMDHLKVLLLEKLEPFIRQNPQIRLVVVDSIAYLTRYDFDGMANERNQMLWEISSKLRELASVYNLCVIVTNHVSYEPGSRSLRPCLGAKWGHYCALRIFLTKNEFTERRTATLIKSIKHPETTVPYTIGPQGICDVEEREIVSPQLR